MAEIVNLRSARKQQSRAASEKRAAENRILFGTSKQQKNLDSARRDQADRRLEGHRRENGGDAE